MHGKKDILLLATYGMEIVECGGTLAKHVKAGGNVQAAVSLVRPENREQVQKAAGVLGVKVNFLDFKSGEVQADVASKSKIVRLIAVGSKRKHRKPGKSWWSVLLLMAMN